MRLRYHVYRLYWSIICSLIFAEIYNNPTIFCIHFEESNASSLDYGILPSSAHQTEQNHRGTTNPSDYHMEQFLSHEVLNVFQMHMLSKLGMAERPAKRDTPLEVPDIFRTMYNRLNDRTASVTDPDPVSDAEPIFDESFWDTARGYPMESFRAVDPQTPSSSHSTIKYELTFNVTTSEKEKIESAQLALMLTATRNSSINSTITSINPDSVSVKRGGAENIKQFNGLKSSYVFITVSRFVRNHTIILDARHVPCADVDRWETFQVDSAVRHWSTVGKRNADGGDEDDVVGRLAVDIRGDACGVNLVSVTDDTSATSSSSSDHGGSPTTTLPLPSVASSSTFRRFEQRHRFAPSLIVYTSTQNRLRHKRDVKRRGGKKHRRRHHNHRQLYPSSGRKHGCARHSLTIDFEAVGWSDWVMAPPSYDAYYCAGSCAWPLGHSANATNHAIMQSLAHSINPRAVPRPSCVPVELGQISMLYVDHYQRIVVKVYHDMVVLGCGCR